MNRFDATNALGQFATHTEFQKERVMIQIALPQNMRREDCLRVADSSFDRIWATKAAALLKAAEVARTTMPEFWLTYRREGGDTEPCAIFGIFIDPDGSAIFDIGPNYEWYEQDPADYHVQVRCSAAGELSVVRCAGRFTETGFPRSRE